MPEVAYNQETGEALRFDGNDWVKTDVAKNDAGDVAIWDGDAWKQQGAAPAPAKPVKPKTESTGAMERLGRGIVNIPFKGAESLGESAIRISAKVANLIRPGSGHAGAVDSALEDWKKYIGSTKLRVDEPKGAPKGVAQNAADIASGVLQGVASFVAASPVGGGVGGIAGEAPGVVGKIASSPIGARVISDTATGAIIGAGTDDATKMGAITGLAGAASFLPGGRLVQTAVQGAIPMGAELVTGHDPLSRESIINSGVQAFFGLLHGGASKKELQAKANEIIEQVAPESKSAEPTPSTVPTESTPSPGKITTKLSERLRSNDPEVRARAWDEAKAMQEEEMLASDTPPEPEPIPQEPLAPPSESPLPFKLEDTPAPQSESAKLDDLMSLIQRPKETPEPAPAEPSPSTTESTAPSAPEARPPEKSEAVSPEQPKPLSAKEKERLNDLNRRLSDLEAERKFAADEGDQATVDSIGRVEVRFRAERDALKERNVSEPQVTGIKNAKVDEERVARGQEPMMEPERLKNPEVWDRAMKIVEKDPQAGTKLIDDLLEEPREISAEEVALLIHERITRKAEFDRAMEDLNDNPNNAGAIRRLDEARARFDESDVTAKTSGTAQARAFQFRQRLAAEDYSLAAMESSYRAEANNGKPLSREEAAEIKAMAKKIEALEAKVAADEAAAKEAALKATFENLIRETKKGAREAKKTGGTLLDKLKIGHDEALKNIKSRMGRTSAGVDPTVLYDVARIGAYHIANGAVKLAEFTKRVVDEVGEWIRPSIKEVFDQAQKIHEEGQKAFEGATAKPTALEKAKANAAEGKPINPQQVFELAREKVNAGITELDKVMEAVHADLAPLHEGLTVRDVRDAFSGYGKVRYPSKAEDLTKLRELKPLARMASAIEDAMNKIPPKKTGLQRDKPTQAVRDMMKRLRDEMRKAGIETTSPEQQLASANQARATALRNQIEDLDRQLQTGQKAERPTPAPDTPEVERLRAERDAMKEKLREIEEAENPPLSEEQKRLKAAKARINKSIEEYKRRIRENDYEPRSKKPIEADEEYLNSQVELNNAKLDFERAKAKKIRENWTKFQKAYDVAVEVGSLPRAILSSMDLSAVGSQGGFVSMGNPRLLKQGLAEMRRTVFNQRQFEKAQLAILQRERAKNGDYKRGKLFLSDRPDTALSVREEVLRSKWSEKIPVAGGAIKASNRAYVAFLNRLRADSFDMIANKVAGSRELTKAEAELIGNYVNVATGRGDLGRLSQYADGLATIFFSPRLWASRFQLLLGQPLRKGLWKSLKEGKSAELRTRAILAGEYAKSFVGMGVVLGLAALAGASIETDPRSTDFLRARFGNTRRDITSRLGQIATLISQIVTGEVVREDGKIAKQDPFSKTIPSHVRNKLSPLFGAAADSLDISAGRKTPPGHPKTYAEVAGGLMLPMSIRPSEIQELMEDQGVPRGVALYLLSFFGVGGSTYSGKSK